MRRHPIAGLLLPVAVAAGYGLFAGNTASAQGPGASGTGIFVPKPRGSEDSLDPNAVAAQAGATVSWRSGDRLTGSVSSIAHGVLRFSGPSFDGEVGIFTTAIREIQFPARGGAEGGRDLIVLMNDDRIFGKVQGMTPTDVAFDSVAVGFLKISNRYIKQIGFQSAASALVRTDFAGGLSSPLQIAGRGGVAGGTLDIGPSATATLALEQSGAVTVVMDFARMGQTWSISLFADQPGMPGAAFRVIDGPVRGPGGLVGGNRIIGRVGSGGVVEGNALTLALQPNGYSITARSGSGPRTVIASDIPANPGGAQEIRFAYDPATTEVKLWVSGQIVKETNAPAGPKQGKYVVFNAQANCVLKSLEVSEGAAPPEKAGEDTDPNNQTILCRSGERMHAESIALAGGVFTVKTTFSEKPLSVPAEKVASITMSKAGRETLPPPEHPVQICLAKSSIIVELAELTAKTAAAKSPYLGDVKIVRDAIQSLRFLTPAPSK